MDTRLCSKLLTALAVAALAACDPVTDPDTEGGDGVRFSYSGAVEGSFAASGAVAPGDDGLPGFQAFAVAQRDSLDGLLLGTFRRTGPSRGDLFILQLRGTGTGPYTCAGAGEGPRCYGQLYIGVQTDGPAAVEEIYWVSGGEVALSRVSGSRVAGTFQLSLQHLDDPARTLAVTGGAIDVPLVEGVFGASFHCLTTRLEHGPDADCG